MYELKKWKNIANCTGLLIFAQSLCEMLEDSTLDSYKAPALNLHMSFLELGTMISLFCEGRIKKGALTFAVEETKNRLKHDVIFEKSHKRLYRKYLEQISICISKSNDEINNNTLRSIVSAANDDIQSSFFLHLKEKLIEICQDNNRKKDITKLAFEFATELKLKGFSKQFILSKAKKHFFSTKIEPSEISNNNQISEFISLFEKKNSEWDVYFIVSSNEIQSFPYMNKFGIKKISKRPKRFSVNPRYTKFSKQKLKGEFIYSVQNVTAKDPHKARENAEAYLNFYADVCRFHIHKSYLTTKGTALSFSKNDKKSYLITKPTRPMESGAIFKKAENSEAIEGTLEIFSGNHFSNASIRDFQKVLDFHHAAMISTDHENQLLDLWAALEGFIPAPAQNQDRISWYLRYTIPALTMHHNEKIFQYISDKLSTESSKIRKIIESIDSNQNKTTNTIAFITTLEHDATRKEIYHLLNSNPLLRFRIDSLSRSFKSTHSIRNLINDHKEKISWHMQRIYTLRNQIAHNASSLPYIRNLVENLHNYLDTIILSVSKTGRRSTNIIDISTALEKIVLIEADYIDSLNVNEEINLKNFNKYVIGENNILSSLYKFKDQ